MLFFFLILKTQDTSQKHMLVEGKKSEPKLCLSQLEKYKTPLHPQKIPNQQTNPKGHKRRIKKDRKHYKFFVLLQRKTLMLESGSI